LLLNFQWSSISTCYSDWGMSHAANWEGKSLLIVRRESPRDVHKECPGVGHFRLNIFPPDISSVAMNT